MAGPTTLARPDGEVIAYHARAGKSPGVLFCGGFKSDMTGTKAMALDAACAASGCAFVRFDYLGHGASSGDFRAGTIGRWRDDTLAVLDQLTSGPQIVVGSSMGGYIGLLLLRRLLRQAPAVAARLRALVLIAPAWDMTEELMWKNFSSHARADIERDGVYLRPSLYGEPYPITRQLIEEGRHHLLARQTFDPGRPVRILHGLQDPDVPWEHTLDLASFLGGDWTEVTAVPDGEHRLSRPQDLAQLFELLAKVAATVANEA